MGRSQDCSRQNKKSNRKNKFHKTNNEHCILFLHFHLSSLEYEALYLDHSSRRLRYARYGGGLCSYPGVWRVAICGATDGDLFGAG